MSQVRELISVIQEMKDELPYLKAYEMKSMNETFSDEACVKILEKYIEKFEDILAL